jgi:hypothetical protein
MKNTTYTNISNTERAVRIIVGLALTYSVLLQTGTLGLAAILPLIAVYPVMTAIIGWDPVYNMIAQFKNRNARTSANTSIASA